MAKSPTLAVLAGLVILLGVDFRAKRPRASSAEAHQTDGPYVIYDGDDAWVLNGRSENDATSLTPVQSVTVPDLVLKLKRHHPEAVPTRTVIGQLSDADLLYKIVKKRF